jgi:hypothetical protein
MMGTKTVYLNFPLDAAVQPITSCAGWLQQSTSVFCTARS